MVSRQREIKNVNKKSVFLFSKKTNLKFLNIHKEENYSKCKPMEIIIHTILSNTYKIYRYMLLSLFLFLCKLMIRCFEKNIFFYIFMINERNEE